MTSTKAHTQKQKKQMNKKTFPLTITNPVPVWLPVRAARLTTYIPNPRLVITGVSFKDIVM
jgi:hypothetical protein